MEKKQQTQGDERLQVYEIGFHIVPIVSVDTLPAEVNAIRSLIENNGGAIIAEDAPKSKSLAYTLSRMRAGKKENFDTAFFGWIKFEGSSASINTIKEGVEKNENILRYLIIKTVRESTLASIVKAPVREKAAEDKKPSDEDKPKMTDEDMDKTIEEMVKE